MLESTRIAHTMPRFYCSVGTRDCPNGKINQLFFWQQISGDSWSERAAKLFNCEVFSRSDSCCFRQPHIHVELVNTAGKHVITDRLSQ